jgi:hypothetical protein
MKVQGLGFVRKKFPIFFPNMIVRWDFWWRISKMNKCAKVIRSKKRKDTMNFYT